MGVSGAGSHADKNIATPDEAMHFSFLICNASFRKSISVEQQIGTASPATSPARAADAQERVGAERAGRARQRGTLSD